jgi:hypothetical protein
MSPPSVLSPGTINPRTLEVKGVSWCDIVLRSISASDRDAQIAMHVHICLLVKQMVAVVAEAAAEIWLIVAMATLQLSTIASSWDLRSGCGPLNLIIREYSLLRN